MGSRKKTWGELSPPQRATVVGLGLVQLGLTAATLRDLRRRSASEVRGRKPLWAVASFLNFVGPIAYFAVGRRR